VIAMSMTSFYKKFRLVFFEKTEVNAENRPADSLSHYHINFNDKTQNRSIPYYLDLDPGDRIDIVKQDNNLVRLIVLSINIESRDPDAPRTRVTLSVDNSPVFVDCGMIGPRSGGIPPVATHGLNIGVEITRLLFSKLSYGKSPFNTFDNFQLKKDLRLSIWQENASLLTTHAGAFVVIQPKWTRDKYGNWLHSTNYGIHSAIDIFATQNGVAEKVVSPVDGTVYKVYNKNASSTSRGKNKVINIFGRETFGPDGGKLVLRFMHLSEIFVSNGDRVEKGQVIGLTGHTGFNPSIGDHLHFEMRIDASLLGRDPSPDIFSTIPINPYNFLFKWWSEAN
jgi:murein DD-endopeptidase MepM/ murein hydrolase activator NlpD